MSKPKSSLPRTSASRRGLRASRATLLLIAATGLLVSACSASSGGNSGPASGGNSSGSTGASPAGGSSSGTSSSASATVPAAKRVHISTLNSDGAQYGVGMPVIAYFSKKFTSAVALQKATTVTVNGQPTKTAWYFETSSAGNGPVEGHLRPQTYWPAHSKIHVDIAAKNVAAGAGAIFDDSLTLDFSIGAANIGVVNNSTHELTITTDGKKYGTFNVSLGARDTPTRSGIKVIMEKGRSICMHGPGYSECGVKYTQRLTYDGEYLHAAPWNTRNIANGVNSSNGCTNLTTADAEKLYGHLEIGDVVSYPNANGDAMTLGEGYGDWNVSWSQWQTGGLITTV